MRSCVALALALFASACAPLPTYGGHELGHPTMAPEDDTTGLQAHVRARTEGATGRLGRP
ncbi:MAG: hypothetical protein IPG50_25210 [Myxococcales bacterium]|nr:hypothetical protein [Myxococcales bacterium]